MICNQLALASKLSWERVYAMWLLDYANAGPPVLGNGLGLWRQAYIGPAMANRALCGWTLQPLDWVSGSRLGQHVSRGRGR